MHTMDRRRFLKHSAAGVVGGVAATRARAGRTAPSDKLGVALMGLGGRGTQLLGEFAKRSDLDIRYLVDVDVRQFPRATEIVDNIAGKVPKRETDFRKVLENPDVDIIINATPDHWHGLGTVLACQAGKHVYVEKPVSQNIWEGRKMVEAARKYNVVVQSGMQNRSAPYVRKAMEAVQAGKLGHVTMVRVHQIMQNRFRPPEVKGDPVPDGLDYDMYIGPAPMVPYRSGLKSMYLTQWDFSAGIIFGDAVHQLDVARYLIQKGYPHSVHSAGALLVEARGRDCPDTQTVTYEYDDVHVVVSGSTVSAALSKTPESIRSGDVFPDWFMNSTRVELYGTEGMMAFGRQGGGWQLYGGDGGVVEFSYGRHTLDLHIEDFVDAIRKGRRASADIEDGHISAAMCHMANISTRVGNRQLQWDATTETFKNDAEANKLVKRTYRSPWVIPEQV